MDIPPEVQVEEGLASSEVGPASLDESDHAEHVEC